MAPIQKRLRFHDSVPTSTSQSTSTGRRAKRLEPADWRQMAWTIVFVVTAGRLPKRTTASTMQSGESLSRGWRRRSETMPRWKAQAVRSSRWETVSVPAAYAGSALGRKVYQRRSERSEVRVDRRARVTGAGSRTSRWRSGTWRSEVEERSSRNLVCSAPARDANSPLRGLERAGSDADRRVQVDC